MQTLLFKATQKEFLRKGELLEQLRDVLIGLGIDTQHKLSQAKKAKQLKIPNYYVIDEICRSKKGVPFDKFFNFKRSVTKPRWADRLTEPEFVERLKKWCFDNNIRSKSDYIANKEKPKGIPSAATILANYGHEYFTVELGFEQKAKLEELMLEEDFKEYLRTWCINNKITTLGEYRRAKKPEGIPSAERIRQLYGYEYFKELLDFTLRDYTYLTREEARDVCIKNGVVTANMYPKFYKRYNDSHEVKLPSDFSRFYKMKWVEFIALTDTQLFLSNSMSALEQFTYKLLYDRGIEFETEKTFENCRSRKPLPFDFYLPNIDGREVIIELDGEQHKVDDKNHFYYSKSTQKHDTIKNTYCLNNKIQLIRIEHIVDIEPILNEKIGLHEYAKKRELDWTADFETEEEVLNSKLSKSFKVKLLLLMAEKGSSSLTNAEIIDRIKIVKPQFYGIKNELIKLGLISRSTDYYFTDEEINELAELYKQGMTLTEIIKVTGYTNRTYLIKRLKEKQIKYQPQKRMSAQEYSELKAKIKVLYFDSGMSQSLIAKTICKSNSFVSVALKKINSEKQQIDSIL